MKLNKKLERLSTERATIISELEQIEASGDVKLSAGCGTRIAWVLLQMFAFVAASIVALILMPEHFSLPVLLAIVILFMIPVFWFIYKSGKKEEKRDKNVGRFHELKSQLKNLEKEIYQIRTVLKE